jgi:hypothetical protein
MTFSPETVLVATLATLLSAAPTFAECSRYSRLPSVDACTRESAKSSKAKAKGYPLAGIRRWCEEWQPQCAPARTSKVR